MGNEHAALGIYQKLDKKNKVYYVNRKNYPFSYYPKAEDGKPRMKVNRVTGQPMTNERGEPELIHNTVMFLQWQPRFNELGYWSIYEVTKDTPKELAEALENAAKSPTSEVMTEKRFIEFSNPILAQHMSDTEKEDKIREEIGSELAEEKRKNTKLEEEIAKLKKKAENK